MIDLAELKQTEFFKKYQGSYVGDKILRDYYKIPLAKKATSIHFSSYEEVYTWNLQIFQDILALIELPKATDEMLWKLAYVIYIDPDGYATRNRANVVCTADALLSFKRIYTQYGFNEQMIKAYASYRKQPLIYFPREKNGINMSRAFVFGDRIDSTLLDLKVYYENGKSADECRLKKAFQLAKTAAFLQSFANFAELVDWLGIRGYLVSATNEVFDLEKGHEAILTDYHIETSWKWSANYYEHVKLAIADYAKASQKQLQ